MGTDTELNNAIHGVGTNMSYEGNDYIIVGYNSWLNQSKDLVECFTVVSRDIKIESGETKIAETKCILRIKPYKRWSL